MKDTSDKTHAFYIGFYRDCLYVCPSSGKRDFGWVGDHDSLGKMRGIKGKIKIFWVDQFQNLPSIREIYQQVQMFKAMGEDVEEVVVLNRP